MKKLPILLFMLLAISFITSCGKEVFDVSPTMEAYYIESVQLPTATMDSVQSFSSKVDGFTTVFQSKTCPYAWYDNANV